MDDGGGMSEYILSIEKTVGICATSFESVPLSSAACPDCGKGRGNTQSQPSFQSYPTPHTLAVVPFQLQVLISDPRGM